MKNEPFDLTNPNKVRALVGGFIGNAKFLHNKDGSSEAFHNKDGSGYKFLADLIIKLNDVNAHTAAAIITPLVQFSRYDDHRQKLIIEQLERIMATPKLNSQIGDLVSKALETVSSKPKKTADFKPG